MLFCFSLATFTVYPAFPRPTVYPGNPQQMIERFTLFGEQAAFMGISFMNDKIMCEYQKFV
ncbi:hypothetical protein ACTPEM_24520, partial [Clostridioides difficile]